MTKDEALKLALEALKQIDEAMPFPVAKLAQASIKEALAQEQEPVAWQEPVSWQVMVEDEAMKEFSIKDMAHDWCVQQKLSGSSYIYWIRPLYAKRIQELETEQDCVGWFGYDTGLRLWFETNKGDDGAIPLYKRKRTHD